MLIPSYKPLEITLILKDKTKSDLKRDLKISSATTAKIGKSEYIHLKTIAAICEYLECTISDVVELVPLKQGD